MVVLDSCNAWAFVEFNFSYCKGLSAFSRQVNVLILSALWIILIMLVL
jgi:hypothetical protein